MKHRIDKNNFNRTAAHRRAMLRNMVISLFEHERIKTTPQKAKSARRLAEKMITLAKRAHLAADPKDALHLRRQAIGHLGGNKKAVKLLFAEIGPRYIKRSGGYTRILRLPGSIRLAVNDGGRRYRRAYGWRLGDGAEQCYLELVEPEVQERLARRPKTSRGQGKRRRGKARTDGGEAAEPADNGAAAEAPAEPAAEPADNEAAAEAPAEPADNEAAAEAPAEPADNGAAAEAPAEPPAEQQPGAESGDEAAGEPPADDEDGKSDSP